MDVILLHWNVAFFMLILSPWEHAGACPGVVNIEVRLSMSSRGERRCSGARSPRVPAPPGNVTVRTLHTGSGDAVPENMRVSPALRPVDNPASDSDEVYRGASIMS